MANFKEKQYTIDDIARIRKGMEENQQRMHEEKAKQTNAAPKYGYKLPTLESKRQERTKTNDIQSMQMANDRMVSQKSTPKKNDMPSRVSKLNGTDMDMTMPSPVNKLTNTPSANLDIQNKPSESLNNIKGGATWTKDTDTRYPKDTWKELSREEIQSLEREARRIQAKGMDASAQEMNRLQEIYEISDNNERNKAIHNKATVDEYINPNRKLSSDEESIAKEIVDNYFKENSKAYKLLHSNNPNFSARIRSQMTEAERTEYEKMTALMNKTSNLSAFTYGMLNIMPFGNTAMDKMGELRGVDPQYNYSAQERNTKSQNPLAFMGGDMTSKLAAYSVLGGELEKIPALAKATNGAGSFLTGGNKVAGNMIGNVLRGDIADIVLDTIPTEIENYRNGMSGTDIAKDTALNLLGNTAFNAVGEVVPYLWKSARGQLGNVAEEATNLPTKSNLEMEREALQSSQNDMDALAQYLRENPTNVPPNAPTPVRPTNLEMEQASNVDNMDVLRQAMAEQQAQVAREEAERAANGIQVYRGYNRSDNPLEKNLAREQSIYDILGKDDPNKFDLLPLEFYTESIDDATNYANHDKLFYDSLRDIAHRDVIYNQNTPKSEYEAMLKARMDEMYRTLMGREPVFNEGHVDTHTINPQKILDLTDLGDTTNVDSVYDLLSRELGIPQTAWEGKNVDDYFNGAFPNTEGYDFNTYMLLKNVGGSNGDYGSKFVNLMRDNGYDAVKYTEDGYNHYALLNDANNQATKEIPRVGEEPSLIAKNPVEEVAETVAKETPTNVVREQNIQTRPLKPANNTTIGTKEMSKIQFANDADRAEFNNAWSEFERANAEFEDALVNAEDEADILDAITRIDDTYRNMQNTASRGTVTDKSGQNSLRDIKKNFKANTKGMVINLPAEMRNEMGFKDMTMRQINSKMSSLGGNDYIKFSAKGGTPIDEVWDELVRASGNQLSPDVANSADMAASLIDYVDSLKVDGRGIEQIEANINNIIPDEYWDDIARRAEEAQQRLVDEGKVIAEDIGINPNTTFDDGTNIIEEEIARNEPYELSFDPSEYENGVEKVSKAYTNTGRNANGWNEAEYNKYTDPSRYTYESKSEIESINKATAMREEEGREAFKNRVLNAEELTSEEVDGLMMEWRETIQEAREIESNGGDASALWEESNRIFKRVQTESTKNAQALQALAKWSRNTPEGLLMHTENVVNGKVKASESELQKFLDKFAKKNKDIEFSADFQKNFLEEAEKLQDLDLNSKEAKDIMGRLGRMTNAELPVRLNEKMQSLLMDNMLGNFRTLITRNAGGNIGLNAVEQTAQRPLAAAIDRLVSHKTGIRTQAGMTKEGLQEYISGFKKGLTDEIHDIRTGLHTSRTGENTIENALNANRHVFKNKVLDKFDSFVKNGLSVGDRPFYEAVYKQTIGDYNRLRATGQMGDIINNLSDADFNTYAETAAHLNALSAVYQNDSAMSQALLGFKRSIGQLSEGTVGFDILSQFSMPFVKTPANVVDRAIDYSPLGLVRNIARTTREGGIGGANFDQNRFVNELSRNILGTGLMGGAAVAASNNILTGAYSDDVDEKQLQKQSGMQEYALNIPTLDGKNYNMDISWLPVVGSNAVAAAAAVDAYRNGEGDVLSNIGSGLVQGGESLFDQSMFQGLQRLFGADNSYNSDTGIVGNALNTVKSGAGQLIPSLARQIAQVSDPYQRDVSNSNGGNYDVNSIINNIPGARQNLLAPKVDANGNLMEESQGRGMGMRFLEDMILPGKITEVTSNELDEEAVRLSDETGSEASFRPKPYRKDIDPDKKLTNEEWVAYEQKFNSTLTEAGNTVINSDAYKGLNAEAQDNLLSNVYKSVKSAINSEYNGKELSGGAKAYAEAGGGEAGIQAVVDYHTKGAVAKEKGLSNNNATQAIYDADGEQGLDNYAAIKESGGTKKTYNSFMLYNQKSGSKELPTLDAKQFMSQVNSIEKYNKDGKINGEVSQQELADYLNAQKYNSSKADAYVKAFFGDDYIAYTTKKNRIGIKKKE